MAEHAARAERVPFLARAPLCAGLIGLAVACLTAWSFAYRHIEALATSTVTGLFGNTAVTGALWLEYHGNARLWFWVTRECSSNVVVAPMLLFAAVTSVMSRRFSIRRVIAGLLVGGGLFYAFNIARLAAVGLAYQHWGDSSRWLVHDVAGTLITVFGGLLALVVQVIVTSAGSRRRTRTFDHADDGAPTA